VLPGQLFAPFGLNHAVRQVGLVGHEHLGHVIPRVLVDLLEPVGDVIECLLLRAVVNQNDAHRAFVVGLRNRAEAFLAGRVPNLQLYPLAIHIDGLDFEVNA